MLYHLMNQNSAEFKNDMIPRTPYRIVTVTWLPEAYLELKELLMLIP